ncbi:hypothetical protein GCM10008090_13120 [Arenicella chitinivorans]|uniref:Lipoprotein n=1 Tax=Arenicella chitinivorans TaxID=1329800 RepID=A0A918RNC4_9GAMM|nr:hypothetical protein [Arenicella chitinivorans]GHA04973.1 hypothetical protein GCM10008090_13120 [Arenicella chitinivorans]
MKTQIKNLVISGAAALVMSGCSTVSRYTLDTDFDAAPEKSKTKMSEALQCLRQELDNNLVNPSAYVFMVRDIIDGTIKHNNYSDGPLSDSGRIQMISTLSAHTHPSYGIVIDQFPLMFQPIISEQVGLDRFGFPSQSNLSSFLPRITSVANTNRNARGMNDVSEVTPLIIDGAFTRNDSSHQRSKGYGQNGGYRGDVEEEKSAAIDFGDSGSERSVTLVVNIIDPQTNVVIGTEAFDLKYYSNSKTARFRVAVDNYYYGFSNTDVRVETLHAAQQTLLDGAAVWILDNAFGNKVDFSPCFDNPDTVAVGRDSRQRAADRLADRADTQEQPEVSYAEIEAELKFEDDEKQPLELEDYVHKAVARDWRVCDDDNRANCE